MDQFYQMCFSRLGGSGQNVGWQLTNVSPNTPQRFSERFERRQKGNEPVGSGTPSDAHGNPLCALEVHSDADGISITRIQYGVPCHGREGLFSHGFLFPNTYDMLKDPNKLLAVSDQNFCFREDTDGEYVLDRYLRLSEQIPEALEYEQGWDTDSALACTGMTQEVYREFVYCLYAAWSKSVESTLFVRTDGTDRMVKAMLYLAYTALPYSLRPKIVASTFADAKSATLIFTHRIPDGVRFFDPKTGESNMLTDNQRKRWQRSELAGLFFDCDPEFCAFDALETNLQKMGDAFSQNIDTLNIALERSISGWNTAAVQEDADPVSELFDLLDLKRSYNAEMELHVAKQLDVITALVPQKGNPLNADMEQMLNARMNAAVSEELKDAGVRFNAAVLETMDVESGAARLRGHPLFRKLRPILCGREKGRAILAAYYAQDLAEVAADPAYSYQDLAACAMGFRDLPGMEKLWEAVFENAERIVDDSAKNVLWKKQDMDDSGTTPLCHILTEYREFIDDIRSRAAGVYNRTLEELDNRYQSLEKKWLQRYDHEFRTGFNPERMAEYQRFFCVEYADREILAYPKGLLQAYLAADNGDIDWLLQFIDGGCWIHRNSVLKLEPEFKERHAIRMSLLRYWADSEAVRQNRWMETASAETKEAYQQKEVRSYEFWERAADASGKNMVSLMLEKGAVLLCERSRLTRSVRENLAYWTDDRLARVLRHCQALREQGDDQAAVCEGILVKAFEERQKQSRKESARQSRKEKKEEKRILKEISRAVKRGTRAIFGWDTQSHADGAEQDPAEPAAPLIELDDESAGNQLVGVEPVFQPEQTCGQPTESSSEYRMVKEQNSKPMDVDDTDSVLGFFK